MKKRSFFNEKTIMFLGIIISLTLISRRVKIEYIEEYEVVELADDVEAVLPTWDWINLTGVQNEIQDVVRAQDYSIDELYIRLNYMSGSADNYLLIQDDSFETVFEPETKFFVYQPSGGWGNQRIILQNALAAANAMDRVLVLPPIAPHNFLYHGYNKFNGTEMTSMDKILDINFLNKASNKGVVVWNDTLAELQDFWKSKNWKLFSKPREVNGQKLTYQANYIKKHWGPNSKNAKYDVVFWNKEGMWLCCAPTQVYARKIVLNNELKLVARLLAKTIDEDMNFNAVHIRRGGGHTGHDRKNARVYYKEHLTKFDKNKPLYIATDEKNMKWFLPFITEFKFSKVLFLEDLKRDIQNAQVLKNFLAKHPKAMENDVIGFIEQLICASALRFEGSSKSTFTFAINTIRRNPKALLGFS